VTKLTKYLAALLLLMLVPTSGAALSYYGFCFRHARFLSDAEIIESAVHGIADSKRMTIDSSDASVKDFLRRYPKCCAVDRHPPLRSWADVLSGWNIAEVEVNYERNLQRPASQAGNFYKQYASVSACGEFLKYRYGTSTPTLETAPRRNSQL
jgi:hypothetical protein